MFVWLFILFIAVPTIGFIGSFYLVARYAYLGAIVSAVMTGGYCHFITRDLSSLGNPNGNSRRKRFADNWQNVIIFGVCWLAFFMVMTYLY
jgi:hypothetical protein